MAAKTEKTAQSSEKTAKPRGKPFPKGQSGNPGGRPKTDPEVKALLKGATPAAAQLLIQLMEDPDNRPELRKACAESILDRVYGKVNVAFVPDIINAGEVLPLEYCEADIKAILVGIRRHRLVTALEQDLLEDAREKGKFVIY